jgi:hypothetical protein
MERSALFFGKALLSFATSEDEHIGLGTFIPRLSIYGRESKEKIKLTV